MPTLRARALDFIVPGLPGFTRGFGPIVLSPSGRQDFYRWQCVGTPYAHPSRDDYGPVTARTRANRTLLGDFLRAYGTSFTTRLDGMCDDTMLLEIEIEHLEQVAQQARAARHAARAPHASQGATRRRTRTHLTN